MSNSPMAYHCPEISSVFIWSCLRHKCQRFITIEVDDENYSVESGLHQG